MNSFIVSPKNLSEFYFLKEYFNLNNIKSSIINTEEKEDLALFEFMKESDRNNKVSREEVMELLSADYES
jgi:hypothetical protein